MRSVRKSISDRRQSSSAFRNPKRSRSEVSFTRLSRVERLLAGDEDVGDMSGTGRLLSPHLGREKRIEIDVQAGSSRSAPVKSPEFH